MQQNYVMKFHAFFLIFDKLKRFRTQYFSLFGGFDIDTTTRRTVYDKHKTASEHNKFLKNVCVEIGWKNYAFLASSCRFLPEGGAAEDRTIFIQEKIEATGIRSWKSVSDDTHLYLYNNNNFPERREKHRNFPYFHDVTVRLWNCITCFTHFSTSFNLLSPDGWACWWHVSMFQKVENILQNRGRGNKNQCWLSRRWVDSTRTFNDERTVSRETVVLEAFFISSLMVSKAKVNSKSNI